MNDQATEKKNPPKGRKTFWISIIVFVFFFVNVLLGKAKISLGWDVWNLGIIGEFLLLLLASTLLISAAMLQEDKPNGDEQ